MKKKMVPAICAVLAAGCSFNPETMPISSRDQAVYVDAGAPQRDGEEKAKVAVRVSVGDYSQYAIVGNSLSTTLGERLSNFAFFDLVDRGAASAIIQEMAATASDPTEIDFSNVEADFVVFAKIASITTMLPKVDVQFDFSWVSLGDSQRVIMKKSIRPTTRAVANETEMEGVLIRAAELAAAEFAQAISSKYAPPARVLQTRGNGEAARINIGRDYGLAEGMEVEFYEIVDNSALGGDKRDASMVALGTVKRVEEKAAWVKVSDFEKVNVRKGVYVRVLERREGIGDKMFEKTGLNQMF